MLPRLRIALAAFIERHIVADDPAPEYSRLDRLNGLGRDTTAEGLSVPR